MSIQIKLSITVFSTPDHDMKYNDVYPPTISPSMSPSPRARTSPTQLSPRKVQFRYGSSFFLLGLLNNVLYVVILSAALDLVDSQATPKVSTS